MLEQVKVQAVELTKSNTLWVCVAFVALEFLRAIDPAWLEAHPGVKVWIAPIIAAVAIAVKLWQNITEKPAS